MEKISLSHRGCVYGPAAQQTLVWKIPSISIHGFMFSAHVWQIDVNYQMLMLACHSGGNVQAMQFSDMFVLACFVNSNYQKHWIFSCHCEFVTVVSVSLRKLTSRNTTHDPQDVFMLRPLSGALFCC